MTSESPTSAFSVIPELDVAEDSTPTSVSAASATTKDVNSSDPVDSDSSSDSDTQEMEDLMTVDFEKAEIAQKQLKSMKEKVENNPFSYESHLSLIKTSKKAGEFDELRSARQSFAKAFPLTPALWLEWIRDEMRFASEDTKAIKVLFERSVKDYRSLDVWLEYCQWIIGNADDPADVRDVFERALTAVGLQANRGCLLWDAYREFETALLATYMRLKDAKTVEDQKDTVLKIFRRQLILPLQGVEQSMAEYKEALVEFNVANSMNGDAVGIDGALTKGHQAALERLETLMPLEDALEETVSDAAKNVDAYKAYIAQELKWGDPSRIQLIYERCVTAHCLNDKVWLQFCNWLSHELKVHSLTIDAYARAVRNCPWITKLWIDYLLALERGDSPWDTVQGVFESSLKGGYSYYYDGIELWLTYAYMIRRKCLREHEAMLAAKGEHHSGDAAAGGCDYRAVVRTFQSGAGTLKTTFGVNEWDLQTQYRRCWAYFVAVKCGDMPGARQIYDDILREGGNGRFAEIWTDYIRLERNWGLVENARKLFFKAVNSVSDYPEVICRAFIQFEKEEGSLEDLTLAIGRVDAQLKRLEERNAKAAAQAAKSEIRRQRKSEKRLASSSPGKSSISAQQIHHGSELNQALGRSCAHKRHENSQIPYIPLSATNQQTASGDKTPIESMDIKPYVSKRKRQSELDRQSTSTMETPPGTTNEDVGAKQTDSEGFAVPFVPPVVKAGRSDGDIQDQNSKARETDQDAYFGIGASKETRNFVREKMLKFRESLNKAKAQNATMTNADSNSQKATVNNSAASTSKLDTKLNDPAGKNDEKQVFISNLNYRTQAATVKQMFVEALGSEKVIDVRLIGAVGGGRSKGYGYVELDSPETVESALKLDRRLVEGRPVYVSRCNAGKRGPENFRLDAGLEKNKLFVRGLSYDASQDEVRHMFAEFAGLKDVRLVMHKSGKSKGVAYVDFETEEQAKNALLRTDGTVFMGRPVNVAFSDPPRKRPNFGSEGSGHSSHQAGPDQRRNRVGLMPRSLTGGGQGPSKIETGSHKSGSEELEKTKQSKSTISYGEAARTTVEDTAKSTKMSNEEFRKKFLKF